MLAYPLFGGKKDEFATNVIENVQFFVYFLNFGVNLRENQWRIHKATGNEGYDCLLLELITYFF